MLRAHVRVDNYVHAQVHSTMCVEHQQSPRLSVNWRLQ